MKRNKSQGLSLRLLLAKNIRDYRKQKKITQEQLAEICGLHRTYVGSVERGERNVTLETLEALASGLGVTPAKLIEYGRDFSER